jgi:hypothetical protein
MRAIEDLVNQVRDASSRVQLLEATRAYEASAFRAAIVSTWVAVALDLVGKLRQLAEDGDANAATKMAALDAAIAQPDVRALQNFETTLLDVCRDDFELIDARDHLALTRLYEDRNVCAHPAFVAPEDVFTPTPELVRTHLRTAVDAVLQHSPAPGKQTIKRFIAESQGNAWPSGREALTDYLRERYFARGKESMRRGLAELFVKGALGIGVTDTRVIKRLGHSARVLEDIDPKLLDGALVKVVRTREEGVGLTDEEILLMIGGLGGLMSLWDAFPKSSIPRVVSCIQTAEWADLATSGALSNSPPEDNVSAAIGERIDAATATEIGEAISARRRPSKRLLDRALVDLNDSPSWRSAEIRMRDEVLPLARALNGRRLERVLQALKENSDVRMASGMPQLLDDLFEETKDNPGAVPVWKDIADYLGSNGRDGDPDDWYAYPRLVKKVAEL